MTPRSCPPAPPSFDEAADPDVALARAAAALGHPARVRVLRFLLARDECFAGAIVEHLPLAQSTVSQHLKVLREAGLVRGEVEGPRVSYCADRGEIERLAGQLACLLAIGGTHAPETAEARPMEFAGATPSTLRPAQVRNKP